MGGAGNREPGEHEAEYPLPEQSQNTGIPRLQHEVGASKQGTEDLGRGDVSWVLALGNYLF